MNRYLKIIISTENPKIKFNFLLRREKNLGEKDILEKKLLAFNDVFAEFLNGVMFDGKNVVKEDELFDVQSWSQYKGDDNRHRYQDRDVVKLWKRKGVIVSLIGIENQDIPDKDMVFRVLSYDGASYRTQLAEKDGRKRKSRGKQHEGSREQVDNVETDTEEIYPVITFVIYYGEEEWKHETTLRKRLKMEDAIKKYIGDYHINLIDLKKLSEDDINKFKKDFKVIADYIANGSKQTTSDVEINHPEEVSELILRLTGEELPRSNDIGNGGKSMEKYFEPLFERKSAEARAEGKAEGKAEGESCLARLISRLLTEGKNDVLKDVLENENLRHGLYKQYGIK